MIRIQELNPFLIIWGNPYLIELVSTELNGDIVRIKFDGKKILSRPFSIFEDSEGSSFNSSSEVKIYVDSIVSNQNKYKIQTLSSEKGKDHRSINYVTELNSGIRLHKKYDINEVSGLLEKTTFYSSFDGTTFSNPVMEVSEVYELDDTVTTSSPSSKNAKKRNKTRKYFKSDGTIDTDESSFKTTEKFYSEKSHVRREGRRRRDNIKLILEDRVALVLLVTGVASDQEDVYSKLVEFIEMHNNELDAWLESGRGDIYNSIDIDLVSTWLDTVIPDNPMTQSNGLKNSIGDSLRTFIIERLKGNK